MNLMKFKFPELQPIDFVFSTIKTDRTLLREAMDRGFYNGNTKYNQLFYELFFNGGKVKFKKHIDEKFKTSAWSYCRAFMSSWEPKHEEKEAICALIMSEILEPELDKS